MRRLLAGIPHIQLIAACGEKINQAKPQLKLRLFCDLQMCGATLEQKVKLPAAVTTS